MLFNSWEFLSLLAATLLLYYLPIYGRVGRVWQITLLLVSSAVFYAWNEPRLLILLGASCLLNAIAVERILFHRSREHGAESEENGAESHGEKKAKRWLTVTVALNLIFLATFKYAGFLANLFPDSLLSPSGKQWFSDIPLPIGISFYTFQGISLVVDTWRRDISPNTAERLAARGAERISSLRDTAFYITFFPQLIAGPIVKAHEFVDQIGSKRWREIDWLTVRRYLVVGYFLKIFVADNLAEQTAALSLGADALMRSTPINLISLLYSYSLQIFADFAGYSLIAIGLGALFGYRLPINFNFPYLSTSITEFWKRWHLSLSSWLRDYLYIPLGGNRKGHGRTYFNLFLVMFLGGLWHGAAWKFALWGSLHGLFLAIERLASRSTNNQLVLRSLGEVGEQRTKNKTASILKWFLTFHLVTLLWLTFLMPDLASIGAFFQAIAAGGTGFSGPPPFALLFYGTAVVCYHAWGWLQEHRPQLATSLASSRAEPIIHAILIFFIVTNPGAPKGFIYFQF